MTDLELGGVARLDFAKGWLNAEWDVARLGHDTWCVVAERGLGAQVSCRVGANGHLVRIGGATGRHHVLEIVLGHFLHARLEQVGAFLVQGLARGCF